MILSDASCFREIAQDAALYFTPKSKTQLVNIIDSLYKNPSLRQEMIQKGDKRIIDFSWKKAALQTSNIYEIVTK